MPDEKQMPDDKRRPFPRPPFRFPLGSLAATPAALATLVVANVSPWTLLSRHCRADWGDLDEHDRKANDDALADGARLLSCYALPSDEKIWVITEADRSTTTLLLPSEY